MKALSVRSPWWWYILHGGKDVENRDWPTHFRGLVLIHASKWWNLEEVGDATEDARMMRELAGAPPPKKDITFRQLRDMGGCIVGQVEIVDCISTNILKSPWFVGDYGFVLARPVAFAKPIPFKGALGFFDVPDSLVFDPAPLQDPDLCGRNV